jgi:hypothetical protein
MPIYTQANTYLSISTPLGTDKLLLKSLHGSETISGLFHYMLELVSEDNNLSFDSIVGESATVSLGMGNESARYLNGIVGRFYQAGADGRLTTTINGRRSAWAGAIRRSDAACCSASAFMMCRVVWSLCSARST